MIDKMYLMMKEFFIKDIYDIKAAWKDFYKNNPEEFEKLNDKKKENKILNDISKIFSKSNLSNIFEEDDIKNFKKESGINKKFGEFLQSNKTKYLIGNKVEAVKYDIKKDPKDLNREQRNNLMIDMMLSVLNNKDTVNKMLNPGNFDEQKRVARLITLAQLGYEYNSIRNKSLDELTSLLDNNQGAKLDILSTSTQVKLHQQNMTAAKLIGIFANHNANHALLQFTEVTLNKKPIFDDNNQLVGYADRVVLNGRSLDKLNQMEVEDGEFSRYISKTLAGFLAASVDAVKDPVLNYLNLNLYTADPAMLLIRLGYTTEEVGMFLSQPAIIDVVSNYNRNSSNGMSKSDALWDTINTYSKLLKTYTNRRPVTRNSPLRLSDLANNIALASNIDFKNLMSLEIEVSKTNDVLTKKEINKKIDNLISKLGYNNIADYYTNQIEVLLSFADIAEASQTLADLVAAMRADTQGGGAGANISNTIIKIRKAEKNIKNTKVKYPKLLNNDIIKQDLKINNIDELRKNLRSNPVGFSQAFYTLGLEATEEMMSKYFPHYQPFFADSEDGIINKIEKMTKNQRVNEKILELIYNDFYAYYLSQYDTFSSDNAGEFINNFAKNFIDYVEKNPELKDLTFIKNLKFIKATKEKPINKLKFINVGQLSSTSRDEVMKEWESLLYESPEKRELAINLFKYCFYCNGFNFGNDSFIHLAPAELKLNIPSYVDGLQKLLDKDLMINDESKDIFIEQFFRNHLDHKMLVPQVGINQNLFLSDGNIKDKISIHINKGNIIENRPSINTELLMMDEGNSVVPYFSIEINNDKYYYKYLSNALDYETGIFNYERIQSLGMRGNFLEYSYNNDIFSTSIIEQEVEDRYDNNPYNLSDIDSFTESDVNNMSFSADNIAKFINNYQHDISDEYIPSAEQEQPDNFWSMFKNNYSDLVEKEVEQNKEDIEQSKNKCK